jgi:hypothetical protein
MVDGAAAPIQRTTIVIGFRTNDDMFKGALENIPAPNPVVAFTDGGAPDAASQEVVTKMTAGRDADRTKLHIVGHGSPGTLASVDPAVMLDTLKQGGHFTKDITDVNLFACYAMMKQDIDDASVAFKVASWIQRNLNEEFAQTVVLKTGMTSNSSGSFASGEPSYEALDDRTSLEAQPIAAYLSYAVRTRLKAAGVTAEQWSKIGDLSESVKGGAQDIVNAVVSLLPREPWGEGTRMQADVFRIATGGVTGSRRSIKAVYTVASATRENFATFPTRMIELESLDALAGQILPIFAATIDAIVKEFTPQKPVEFAFEPMLGSGGSGAGGGGGFTFGAAPTSGGGGFTFGGEAPVDAATDTKTGEKPKPKTDGPAS